MSFLEHKIPPPIVGALVALAMWGSADLGPRLAFADTPKLVTALLLFVTGIAFDVLGVLAFRTSRTTINPLSPERATALVTGGIYTITRNPMYVGMSLLLLAWAVWLSSLGPFAGPIVFVLYITRFQIQPEEAVLLRLFGEDYRSYASRVRRWI